MAENEERSIIVKDILNNLYDSLKSDITNPKWMKEFEEYIRGKNSMADKEKRILVLEVSQDCKALRINCDPFDYEDGMFCDKSGRYVRITEKDCKKCKSPVLAGITRAKAVEIMAKAMNKERCHPALKEDIYWQEDKKELLREAEAALDALLEQGGGK